MKKVKRFICIIMATFIIISAPLTSYMEAQAAETALWALKSLLENVMVSVGLSAAGYVRSELSISDEEIVKEYIKALDYSFMGKRNPFLSSFLDQNGEDYLALCLKYKAGETINAFDGGITLSGSRANGLSIGLSNNVTSVLADAVTQYLKSDKNVVDKAYGKEEEGTVDVDSDYVSSITTTVNAVTSIKSMDDIDDYFSIEGAAAYLKSEGYSDSKYYFLIYAGGSLTYIMPIPISYSVVVYKLSWLGKTGKCIMSNHHYKSALSQCGVRDSSSFYSYFNGLPSYTGQYYVYNASSGEWTVNADKNYLPGVNRDYTSLDMSNWYFCNAKNAYTNGCTVNLTRFGSEIERKLYTYKTTGNAISYDPSRAMDYTDGVSFSFSDSDVMDGLDGYDLDTLMGYLSTLSEEMAEWREQQTQNQETIIGQNKEIIEQNKNLLTAVGGINSTSAKINTGIGKAVSFLSSIADRILDLPAAIFNSFSDTLGQFMTAEHLETLINGIPVVLAGVLSDAYADTQISVLPGILSDVLSNVFPDAASAINALAELPAVIISAVSGIQIKVPDIVIPEIKVPDVTIPDVHVDAPAVTLNPTFDVTVANDYAGLDGIISGAVEGVMTDVFVPDEAATLEKVGKMQEYFKFKDDMEVIIYEFKRNIFGIKPSPVLKIPIGKPSSQKYNYGTGGYVIIDVSWYAKYKDFGDKIILAFAWVFFIWRVFVHLPGIISGGVGGLQSIGDAYTVYRRNGSGD